MKTATSFKVISYEESNGHVLLEWDNGIILNHRVPVEYETEAWTDDQLRAYFLTEAPIIADIPMFIKEQMVTDVANKFGKSVVLS